MRWLDAWGPTVRIAVGISNKEHLANAIKEHLEGAPQIRVYAHTGWAWVNGDWVYLHGGGAVNSNSTIHVSLPKQVEQYRLPCSSHRDQTAAALELSMMFLG
jgi:hypothetical protein